jgi:hypothetical protein
LYVILFLVLFRKIKKKLRKILKFKNIFFLSQPPFFHKKQVHWVNTSQTVSTRIKNEYQAISGQNCHFQRKPISLGNTGHTMSTGIKKEF